MSVEPRLVNSQRLRRRSERMFAVKYQVAVLEGDGIGPEVVPAAVELAEAAAARAGVAIDWRPLPIGWKAIGECGDPMPAFTKEALASTHGWIMGPHDSAS